MKKLFILISFFFLIILSSCDLSFNLNNNSAKLVTNNQTTENTSIDTKVSKTTVITNTLSQKTTKLKEEFTYEDLLNKGISISKKNINIVDVNKVNFVEINDTHGCLTSDGDYMSLSEVDALIDYLDTKADSSYIRIMNGDLFQGSYVSRMTYGKCMLDALNAMDFDLMTLGNHEFDWGLDKIEVYFDGDLTNGEANFPLVCCNLIDNDTKTRPEFVKPYHIIEYGDVRVGVIGAIGGTLETSIDEDSLGNYSFDSIDSYIKKYTTELRNYGCDVVILSVHDYDQSYYSKYADYKHQYRLDAMIFGHTHQKINGYYEREDGYMIPYVQSYTKNLNIGTISINLNSNNEPVDATIEHYNKSYYSYYVKNESQDVLDVINIYKNILDSGKEVVYQINVKDYDSKEECADFGIKALMNLYNCDMGFLNSGGVRATLSNSNVTVEDIFEIYPFDNQVVIAYMTGTNLYNYLSHNSGLYYNAEFNKNSIDKEKTYKVCTISYIAKKNDNYMENYCVNNEFTTLNDIMRDKVVEYYRSLN